jgi:hypothetical protein
MKVRTISLCISSALLISFSASTVFADVNPVTDRSGLISSDTIFWDVQGINIPPTPEFPEFYSYLVGSINTPNVFTPNGTAVAVSQSRDLESDIIREPSFDYFRDTNFENEDYLLGTFALGLYPPGYDNEQNPVTFVFSDTNVEPICGFGTQIAPYDLGEFTAELQAFDGNGPMGLPSQVTGSDGETNAAFIGLSSTTAMTKVEIVIKSTGNGSGSRKSWYAINQVTLTYCSDLPLTCEGFAAPMANYPVTAKKNRVFPLKMELFDEYGLAQTDVELVPAPVVTVTFTPEVVGSAFDASDLLSAGHGSDGNVFDFTDDGIWQFNLKSKGLASGTYDVTVDSGNPDEYVIDSPCHTSFIIK